MVIDLNNLTEHDIDNMDNEQLDELARQLDQEPIDSKSDYGAPTPEKKDSTLVLFREIIKSEDTKKLGNLDIKELGKLEHTARGLLAIGLFCDSQGIPELAQYFDDKAEIIFATSLSLKAKLIDNIVTQIKKEQKIRSEPLIQKKGWFAPKQTTEGEQQ